MLRLPRTENTIGLARNQSYVLFMDKNSLTIGAGPSELDFYEFSLSEGSRVRFVPIGSNIRYPRLIQGFYEGMKLTKRIKYKKR